MLEIILWNRFVLELFNMVFDSKPKIFFLIGVVFLLAPFFVSADYAQQKTVFSVDPSYDLNNREQFAATLQEVTPKIYFYIDDNWWDPLDYNNRVKVKQALYDLGQEFESRIYPILTSTFGSEWKPGIDNDQRITVLIFPMQEMAGGYFNSADEYSKLQIPSSNEREMVYLNADYVTSSLEASFLAHEFTHLISFNQKDRIYGVSEEVWLNEARSETAITLLGYNDIYEGSNLQRRVRTFLDRPYDSLTEWTSTPYDYGVLNLFTQYLIDHYGINILVDSLHSPKAGIPSINYALKKNGFDTDFSQIFTDWTIAVLVNDCSLGVVDTTSSTSSQDGKYCYKSPNLKNFKVIPVTNFLPFMGESALRVSDATKEWAGNWYRITGGRKTLKLEFTGSAKENFTVPYVVQDVTGKNFVRFLHLDKNQRGTLYVPSFGEENTSLTIIPSVGNKISGFGSSEPSFDFSWTASTVNGVPSSTPAIEVFEPNKDNQTEQETEKQIGELTEEELSAKIAEIRAQIQLLQIQLITLLQWKIIQIQNQIADLKSQL